MNALERLVQKANRRCPLTDVALLERMSHPLCSAFVTFVFDTCPNELEKPIDAIEYNGECHLSKRQMFGRAPFDLLRLRVLHAV